VIEESDYPPWWKFCAVCGDRVGIYETVFVEHPEGTMCSSYLNLDPATRHAPWRFLHFGCAVPECQPRQDRDRA